MKGQIFFVIFFSSFTAIAQDSLSYSDLLKSTEEILLTDSLNINAEPEQKNLLDSIVVKKWFSNILPGTANNRLKNRNYYLAGKVTRNENFDLLVLLEEKKKPDSNSVQVAYLISIKKNGTYIASLEAAVTGVKKRTSYNTSSWLYKNNKIVLISRMTVNQKSYDDLMNYKINGGGRFILYPKYE